MSMEDRRRFREVGGYRQFDKNAGRPISDDLDISDDSKLQDPRKWAAIYRDLAFKLAKGELKPGDIIAIVPLAKKYDVTRPTVARALRELESDGEVRLYKGHGWRVEPHQDERQSLAEAKLALLDSWTKTILPNVPRDEHGRELFGYSDETKLLILRAITLDSALADTILRIAECAFMDGQTDIEENR